MITFNISCIKDVSNYFEMKLLYLLQWFQDKSKSSAYSKSTIYVIVSFKFHYLAWLFLRSCDVCHVILVDGFVCHMSKQKKKKRKIQNDFWDTN